MTDHEDERVPVPAGTAGYDPFLAALVRNIDETHMNLDITLSSDGAMLSGRLISAETWYVSMDERLKSVADARLVGDWETARAEHSDRQSRVGLAYLHLKETYVHTNPYEALLFGDGGLWRTPLIRISGWAIGRPTLNRDTRPTHPEGISS
jgi:hypothetical protein